MKAKSEPPEPFRAVKITGEFWRGMIERNGRKTLPHVLEQCEAEGDMRNLQIAAGLSDEDYSGGPDRDSDLFKVMEGAAYCLALSPDPELDARLDELIELIGAAVQPDGYLQSYYSSQAPDKRYSDLQRSHELYCAGHLFEAAVAHVEATGKHTFLDIAKRVADHVDATFGPGKFETLPGHQEIELALVRLFHATGENRYLDLSRYFLDMRGNRQMVAREYGGKPIIEGDRSPGRNRPPAYRQDHMPLVDQREAIGHAVRAGYTYAAMADIAMAYASHEYAQAAKDIWDNVVGKKLYLSGGVGTHQYHDEGFGDNYVLPNTGYCETCGGVAFMLFSQRMALLTGEAKYVDVVELILYNHLLSSTDLSGCRTFYRNPLSSQGPRKRHSWNHPACCPTNVVRTVPQIARLAYAISDNSIYVDQFAGSSATLTIDSGSVQLTQETNYPWEGGISITVTPVSACRFALCIRIPGWVVGHPVPGDLYTTRGNTPGPDISVNGEAIDTTLREKGYCVIERTWRPDDVVTIDFPMPVQRTYAHPNVEADRGRAALMRGPVLYCLEETDLGMDPEEFSLSPDAVITAEYMPDFLGGVTVLGTEDYPCMAVPFYAWNNREPGRMAVWHMGMMN